MKNQRQAKILELITTRQVETQEQLLALLEAEEKQLDERLAEVAADYKEVQKVTSRQEEVRAEIDALYAEYETLV